MLQSVFKARPAKAFAKICAGLALLIFLTGLLGAGPVAAEAEAGANEKSTTGNEKAAGLAEEAPVAEDEPAVRTYIIGTSGHTKPLDYFNEQGELDGYEVAVIEEMERRAPHLHFEYEVTEYGSLFAGLDAGKFDLVMNNLGESAERREKYLYAKFPYIVTHNVIITQSSQPDNLAMEDLAGLSFGVVPGAPQVMFLERWNETHPDLAVKIVYQDTNPATIIQDVYHGRLDATIYATTYLKDVEDTYGIKLKAHPIANEEEIRPPGSYFIYRWDSLDLRQEMDALLAEMRADGSLKAISLKYTGQDDSQMGPDVVERNEAWEERLFANKQLASEALDQARGRIFAPELITYFLPAILAKLPVTLLLTLVASLIGLSLGLLWAWIKLKNIPALKQLVVFLVSYLRGTPQIVQLFLAYYGLPILLRSLNPGLEATGPPALLYAFIALGLNQAAFNSETIRAAILSVPTSEIEAAKSLGLTEGQSLRRIILPTALINAIPNLGNSLISLLKGSSLAFTVTVVDIMGQAKIMAGANLRYFEAYLAVSLIYWLLCLAIEGLVHRMERRLDLGQHPQLAMKVRGEDH